MTRRDIFTGKFRKETFQLVVHDFGNFAYQIIAESEDRRDLEYQANNLNNLFINARNDKQFLAAVYGED